MNFSLGDLTTPDRNQWVSNGFSAVFCKGVGVKFLAMEYNGYNLQLKRDEFRI